MSSTQAQASENPLNTDLHPPLSAHEARVESARCYFCYDAPCVNACPTGIDIPLFIRQIHANNITGAAKTIFDENIFGGMCARVCPTETLCEQVCVRNVAEEKPVQIGLLQRHATDFQMALGKQPYTRASASTKRIAVIGAGPAGVACAHRLALHGHSATVFEARQKGGGLNEYGIASYKTVDDFAQRELDYILSIGGIELKTGAVLGKDISLEILVQDFDAVFLGIGLSGTNRLNIGGENAHGVIDAVDFISDLRQARDYRALPVARDVVVIGGGMTAIDAAVQSRLLGSENVTLVYRRAQEQMKASQYEQELAQIKGVVIKPNLQPLRVISDQSNQATAVEFENTAQSDEKIIIPATSVLKAIGQTLLDTDFAKVGLECVNGKLLVDAERRSSHQKVWAGGDCIVEGSDLTVSAVQDGKLAAESIHKAIMG